MAHVIIATLVQTPIPPQGASGGQYVIVYVLVTVPLDATKPNPMCHRTSTRTDDLKPDRRNLAATTGLQRCSHAVPQLVPRLKSRNLERHDVWQHNILFVSYFEVYASTYILLLYHQLYLLLAAAPMYSPAALRTVVCYICCTYVCTVVLLKLTAQRHLA